MRLRTAGDGADVLRGVPLGVSRGVSGSGARCHRDRGQGNHAAFLRRCASSLSLRLRSKALR